MLTMIKLRLDTLNPTVENVLALPGMAGLETDPDFGLIRISQKEPLFLIGVKAINHLEQRKAASPEILEAYGDVRISSSTGVTFTHE